MNAKDLIVAATTKLFGRQDLTAIDEYFGPGYIQHSTLAADGLDGLRALAGHLPGGFRYEPVRAIGEGDLVVTHGIYHGCGADPLVGFGVWRVAEGRIVEHWDALAPVVAQTASGRSQTDGPTEPTDLGKTATNKELVTEWVQRVLIGQDYSVLTDYVSTESYRQHNPEAADGLDGFGAAAARWAQDGKPLVYTAVHQIIAEGDFVFTRSEGTFGVPAIYCDLWRVENGRIAEHWDVVAPIPADLPHGNGVF